MKFIHVGVGGFGQKWVRVLKESPAAEVVGLVDVKDDALRQACAAGGYRAAICFPSLAQALKKVKADAVVVSTPPAFHRQDVMRALRAGLHVVSEKPMSDSLPACKAMVKAMQTGRKVAVCGADDRRRPD